MALAVPALVAVAVEPAIGVLGDRGHRRRLVLAGGIAFALALATIAAAPGYGALVAALVLAWSASGAFVSLSEATLMDAAPTDRDRNMARWTLAGAVGVAAAPLLVALVGSWRPVFAAYAAGAVGLVVLARPIGFDGAGEGADPDGSVGALVRAVRSREVMRWLALLELQDIAGDVLYGYLALYLVDVAGAQARTAALAVGAWAAADLVGTAVVLRVLHRVDGLRWTRATAVVVACVFPAFQLVDSLWAKLALVTLVALLHAAWYPVAKARLYAALPGRSGGAMAVGAAAAAGGAMLQLALGLLADGVGLRAALWVVMLAPLSILVLVPRRGLPSSGGADGGMARAATGTIAFVETQVRGRVTAVRAATEDDVDLLVAWHADPETARYWDDETFTPEQITARLRREEVDPWIVEADGEPVGYIQSWWEPDEPRRGGLDGFLIPPARGRGLMPDAARALARALLAAGWAHVTVDPYAWNERAIRGWRKAGFERVEERPRDDEHPHPWCSCGSRA